MERIAYLVLILIIIAFAIVVGLFLSGYIVPFVQNSPTGYPSTAASSMI
jgi:hypothetical protein